MSCRLIDWEQGEIKIVDKENLSRKKRLCLDGILAVEFEFRLGLGLGLRLG